MGNKYTYNKEKEFEFFCFYFILAPFVIMLKCSRMADCLNRINQLW